MYVMIIRRDVCSICGFLCTISYETQVIRLNQIIRRRRNEMDDRAVYFHVVDSEVNSCWDVKDVSSFVI